MKPVVKRLRFNEKAQLVFGHKKVAGVSYQRIFDALVEAEWNRMHKKRVGCCPFMKKGGDGYIIASETYDVHL